MPVTAAPVTAALAWAGLRHRPLRWLLLSVGIAVASVLPVVAGGLQLTAESAAIRAAVDDIPAPSRTVLASSGATVSPGLAATRDQLVRARFAELGLDMVHRLLAFRPLSLAGSSFTLGADDDLGGEVRLTGGRLPRTCTPTRCEVVLTTLVDPESTTTSPAATPALSEKSFGPAAGQLGLVLTGTAELLDQRLVGGGLIDADQPLLLGGDVAALAQLNTLLLFGRTTGWLSSLRGDQISAVGLSRFSAGLSSLADEVNLTAGALAVRWPEDQVAAAADRAVASAARFGVLGAGAAVLQLGFCLSAAVGLRRRQQWVSRLLARRGAGRVQLALLPVVPVAIVVAIGLVSGGAIGFLAVAVAASKMPSGRLHTAWAALSGAWPTLLWLAAGAAVLAVAVALWPADAERPTMVALDCLLLGAVGVVVLVLKGTGGAAGDAGVNPLTTGVTTLISICAGLVAARAWPLLVSAFRRVMPAGHGRAGLVVQVAVLGVQRRALTPAVAAGFLAAATCSVVFAGSYQATLRQSAAEQASFQVPLDASVSPSRDVTTPLSVLDARAVTALGSGTAIWPLVTSSVTVFPGTGAAAGLPLTGMDGNALRGMHDFGAVTGTSASPAALAARLTAGQAASPPRSVWIPAGTRDLELTATGVNDDITVGLWVATAEGAERNIVLERLGAGLRAAVDTAVPVRVVGVELAESSSHLVHRQHAVGEGSSDHALAAGLLTLGSASVDGRPLAWSWAGWGSDTASVRAGGAAPVVVVIGYRINDARVVINPAFVARTGLPPLPVLVDPETARSAVGGIVTVSLSGLTIRGRIVAVLQRMPTFGARFLVADQSAVAALLDRAEPGTAVVSQVWISAPPAALPGLRSLLATPPAATAEVRFRSTIEQRLAADPVATRSAALLSLAGIIALLMGSVAMASSVRFDRQDSAADHLAWEVDGLGPPGIRRVLLLRVCAVIGLGVPIGAVAGVALTGTAVRLTGVGAGGSAVQPPLAVKLGIGWTAAIVGATVLACLLASALSALAAFRERYPTLPEMDLR